MSPFEAAALAAAGVAAGAINTIVGSGSLITFPALLAFGYPPIAANITNNVGVLPGSVSGAYAYRRELAGQRRRVLLLATGSLLGGASGAALLLRLPPRVFTVVVPVLVLLACVLVVVQPVLSRRLGHLRSSRRRNGAVWLAVAATGVYGGYFGAAQGVLLVALLATFVDDTLQRLNALKNVLAGVANAAAAVVFVSTRGVAWGAALAIASGAIVGGQVGGRIGRRLPPTLLRVIIVIVGLVAVTKLVLG